MQIMGDRIAVSLEFRVYDFEFSVGKIEILVSRSQLERPFKNALFEACVQNPDLLLDFFAFGNIPNIALNYVSLTIPINSADKLDSYLSVVSRFEWKTFVPDI